MYRHLKCWRSKRVTYIASLEIEQPLSLRLGDMRRASIISKNLVENKHVHAIMEKLEGPRANLLFRATKAADFKNGSPRKLLSQRFFWESFSNNSAKKHSKFEHFFSQSSQKQIQIQECISRSASFCLAARLVLQSRLVSSGMDELLPFTASIAKISGIVVFFAFVVRSLRRIFCLGKKSKPQNILNKSVPLVKNGSMEELDANQADPCNVFFIQVHPL